MLKRLLIAAVISVVLLAAVTFLVPETRLTLYGVPLRYNFQGEPEHVGWIVTVAEAQEVRGPDQTGPLAIGDSRNLQADLLEKVESTGSEVVLGYEFGACQVVSLDVKPAPSLSANRLQVRVLPQGGVAASQSFAKFDSPFTEDTVLQVAFGSLWPKLPGGWSRPGRPNWSASYSAEIKDRMLDTPVRIDHKLTYSLDRFKDESGLNLAEIHWTGTVEFTGATGKGTVSGSCFFDLDHGRCVTGAYQVEQEFQAPLKSLPGNMALVWHQAQHGQLARLKAGQAGTPTPTP